MFNAELAVNLVGLFAVAATFIGITWFVTSTIRGELKRKRPTR